MRIEKTWQNYWDRHKNHQYGACFANHDLKKFYINIPKCASNWGKFVFKHNLKWESTNYHDAKLLKQGYTAIVFLRNPIDRWASGMAEYIDRYGYNVKSFTHQLEKQQLALDIINKTAAFDEHTVEQITFLEDLDTDATTWFSIESDLNQNVADYVRRELGIENDISELPIIENIIIGEPMYTSVRDKDKDQNKQWFLDNIIRFTSIEKHFKLDIDLYNNVKFYTGDFKL